MKSIPVTVRFARIERQVDAGADADLEHALARLDVHALDRLQPAGMQRRAEGEVVNLGELVVHRLDKVVFDGRDRQRPRGRVARSRSSASGFAIE